MLLLSLDLLMLKLRYLAPALLPLILNLHLQAVYFLLLLVSISLQLRIPVVFGVQCLFQSGQFHLLVV